MKPILYLLLAGSLLGLSTTLAKVAGDMGLAAFPFLTWSLFGATVILMGRSLRNGNVPSLSTRTIEYFFIAAFVTVAGSNLIFFSAVPVVGAGFVSLAITLPPLLTYGGALVFKLEHFSLVRFVGVLSALAGAAFLALNKLTSNQVPAYWIALTLVGPVLLAIGNLYRTLRWPPNASPEQLAPGMLAAATLMLLAAGMLPQFDLFPSGFQTRHFLLIGVQAGVFASQFLVMFLLQKTGGPVLLSLLGSVGAVVTVPIALLVLGEAAPDGLYVATVLIALGIVLLNLRRS